MTGVAVAGRLQSALQAHLEIGAVGETRQRIMRIAIMRFGRQAAEFGEIARNHGQAGQASFDPHRGQGQRHIDGTAAIALHDCFGARRAGAAGQFIDQQALLDQTTDREQHGDRTADHLFRRIAEDLRGGAVPTGDEAVDRSADDGIAAGLGHRIEFCLAVARLALGGAVGHHGEEAGNRAVGPAIGDMIDAKIGIEALRPSRSRFGIGFQRGLAQQIVRNGEQSAAILHQRGERTVGRPHRQSVVAIPNRSGKEI